MRNVFSEVVDVAADAVTTATRSRAAGVTLYGGDERLWSLLETEGIARPNENGLVLNSRLADQLRARVGDAVTLWVELPATIPRDSLLGGKDEQTTQEMKLSVEAILDVSAFIGASALAGSAAFGAGAAGVGAVPCAYAVAAKANAHKVIKSLFIEFFLKVWGLTGIFRVDALNASLRRPVDTLCHRRVADFVPAGQRITSAGGRRHSSPVGPSIRAAAAP